MSKKQKVKFCVLVVYMLLVVICSCILGDRVQDLFKRRIIVLIMFLPLIVWGVMDFAKIFLVHDDETEILKVKNKNYFLSDSGYEYTRFVYNQKIKAYYIFFQKVDFPEICIVFSRKTRCYSFYVCIAGSLVSLAALTEKLRALTN